MENNPIYDYESIDSAFFHIYNQFGYEDIKDSEVYAAAQIVLPIIGNTHVETYHYVGKVDQFSLVKLPCNVYKIESVTAVDDNYDQYEDLTKEQDVISHTIDGLQVRSYLRQTKSNLHAPGAFVNFKFTGSAVHVDDIYKNQNIYIIYKGIIADADGNPKVTSRESIAIAYYYNFLKQQKALFNGTGGGDLLALSKEMAFSKISEARSPVYISQNELDQLKKIHKSGNRWKYNKPYKYTI